MSVCLSLIVLLSDRWYDNEALNCNKVVSPTKNVMLLIQTNIYINWFWTRLITQHSCILNILQLFLPFRCQLLPNFWKIKTKMLGYTYLSKCTAVIVTSSSNESKIKSISNLGKILIILAHLIIVIIFPSSFKIMTISLLTKRISIQKIHYCLKSF